MTPAAQDSSALDLLLVEDTPSIQMLYRTVLTKAGYPPTCASTGKEALAKFIELRPGIVLLDLMLPDIDGLALMTQMLVLSPETRVIVVTANGSINKAVEATRKGAYDFLVKPLGDVRLVGAVASATSDRRAMAERAKGAASSSAAAVANFVALSDHMQTVHEVIRSVAQSKAPVFIHGASGTGKRTVAATIHALSPRAHHPFVTFKCAGLDSPALESALFGTGPMASADQNAPRNGAIARAANGTLVLCNPESLPPEHQARLLTVLNTATLSLPMAGAKPVDIRILCTSSRDPHDALRAGLLSEELFYRLYVIPLTLPSLRERSADIAALAEQFLPEIAQQEHKAFTEITPEAMALLRHHSWEGNLHELRNVLRQAVVLHDGPALTAAMLPKGVAARSPAAPAPMPRAATLHEALAGMTLAEIEEHVIRAAIERHRGSIPRAAQELDIAPSTIYRKRDGWTDPPY